MLTERSLTLDKAIQICQLNELSENYGKQLSKREPDKQDVNCLKSKKQLRKRSPMLSSKSCGGEYFSVRDELVVENGVILKGQRMVVPKSLRLEYIEQLHRGHPGIDATKRRARNVVYWPTMTKDIELVVSSCKPCNSTKPHQTKEPMKSHSIPELPWTLVSADIFEWNDSKYLVTVDTYSIWFEIGTLRNMSSKTVIIYEDEASFCSSR